MAYLRVFAFTADVWKIPQLDFSNDAISSIIDWAIFTDLLFSVAYLGPCVLLVLANRSSTLRNKFLNLVMFIGDHSKGPFVAVAEFLSPLLTFLQRLTKSV